MVIDIWSEVGLEQLPRLLPIDTRLEVDPWMLSMKHDLLGDR